MEETAAFNANVILPLQASPLDIDNNIHLENNRFFLSEVRHFDTHIGLFALPRHQLAL